MAVRAVTVAVAVIAIAAIGVNGHAGLTSPPCRTYKEGDPNSYCNANAAQAVTGVHSQCGYIRSSDFTAGCPGPQCNLCTDINSPSCIWRQAVGCGEPATQTMTTTNIKPGPLNISVFQNVPHRITAQNFTALNSYTFYLSTTNHLLDGNVFLGSFKQPNTDMNQEFTFPVVIPPMPYGEPVLGFLQMKFQVANSGLSSGFRTYYSCASISIDAEAPTTVQSFASLSNTVSQIQSSTNANQKTLGNENDGVVSQVDEIDKLVKNSRQVAAGISGTVLALVVATLALAFVTCRRVGDGPRAANMTGI